MSNQIAFFNYLCEKSGGYLRCPLGGRRGGGRYSEAYSAIASAEMMDSFLKDSED